MRRKIIQVTMDTVTDHILVLCDDGTLWKETTDYAGKLSWIKLDTTAINVEGKQQDGSEYYL